MGKRNGFTLIEFLIVLALIAIVFMLIIGGIIRHFDSNNCKARAVGSVVPGPGRWVVVDKVSDRYQDGNWGSVEYNLLIQSPSGERCLIITDKDEWCIYVVGDKYPRLLEQP